MQHFAVLIWAAALISRVAGTLKFVSHQWIQATSRSTHGHDAWDSIDSGRVLLFWAVSSEDRVMDLVIKNVDHLRQSYTGRADVFLAHYDHNKQIWIERHGDWFQRNVKYSEEATGYKMQLMQQLLFTNDMHVSDYDWVWAMDQDIDFTDTNLVQLFKDAEDTGSLLVLPSFTDSDNGYQEDKLMYPMQSPHPDCSYRYVPMIEVIFPLIRPAALSAILTDCDHCMHEHSVWGLDRVWCAFAANRLGKKREKACAILDQVSVIHRDFRSLPGKYNKGGHLRKDFLDAGNADMNDVEEHHKKEYVQGDRSTISAYTCVV